MNNRLGPATDCPAAWATAWTAYVDSAVLISGAAENIVIANEGRIFRVNPGDGSWLQICEGTDLSGTSALGAYGPHAFVISDLHIWQIDVAKGTALELECEGEWEPPCFMAANEDGLFNIHNDDLFHVDTETKQTQRLSHGRDWMNTAYLVAI